jgi:phosphinothricin acetyltransferase
MITSMVTILPMQAEQWQAIKEIYEEGIRTGNATFEKQAPEYKVWDDGHLKHSRLIAKIDHDVAGWAALSPASARCVYAGVAVVSVYVGEKYRGQKIGKLLLQSLIEDSEKNNIWTLQSGIFPENKASIKIHEANGFRIIGYREKIGQMNGIWRDTILLERRSKTVANA